MAVKALVVKILEVKIQEAMNHVMLIRVQMIQASVILATKIQVMVMMMVVRELKHWADSVYYSSLLAFLKLVAAAVMIVTAMKLQW